MPSTKSRTRLGVANPLTLWRTAPTADVFVQAKADVAAAVLVISGKATSVPASLLSRLTDPLSTSPADWQALARCFIAKRVRLGFGLGFERAVCNSDLIASILALAAATGDAMSCLQLAKTLWQLQMIGSYTRSPSRETGSAAAPDSAAPAARLELRLRALSSDMLSVTLEPVMMRRLISWLHHGRLDYLEALPAGLRLDHPEAADRLEASWLEIVSRIDDAEDNSQAATDRVRDTRRQADVSKRLAGGLTQSSTNVADSKAASRLAPWAETISRAQIETLADGTPAITVVHAILDTGKESSDLLRSFAALTKPLPLRGASVLRWTPSQLSVGYPERLQANQTMSDHPSESAHHWDRDAALLLATLLELQCAGFGAVIDDIVTEASLALHLGQPWLQLRPRLLVGPPGCGKTHFATVLGAVSGCGSALLSAGGSSDSRMLAGTARGWSSAQPCWPLLMMQQLSSANPVLIVDEIDKVAADRRNGSLHHTLLAMLEPGSAGRYQDECLLAPANLRHINWIFTANSLDPIPAALRSRLKIHHIAAETGPIPDSLIDQLLVGIARDHQVRFEDLPPLPAQIRKNLTQLPRGDTRRLQSLLRRCLAFEAARLGQTEQARAATRRRLH